VWRLRLRVQPAGTVEFGREGLFLKLSETTHECFAKCLALFAAALRSASLLPSNIWNRRNRFGTESCLRQLTVVSGRGSSGVRNASFETRRPRRLRIPGHPKRRLRTSSSRTRHRHQIRHRNLIRPKRQTRLSNQTRHRNSRRLRMHRKPRSRMTAKTAPSKTVFFGRFPTSSRWKTRTKSRR
jgi:hypothetical protein